MSSHQKYSEQVSFSIPETMQAVVSSGRGFENLAVKEVAVPKITANQLLARVDAAGVCTSILKLIDQGPEHTLSLIHI